MLDIYMQLRRVFQVPEFKGLIFIPPLCELFCNLLGLNLYLSIPVILNPDAKTAMKLSCDFEDPNNCGWVDDELHDFDWKRLNKKTPSSFLNTGPSFDHTFGEGGTGTVTVSEGFSLQFQQ